MAEDGKEKNIAKLSFDVKKAIDNLNEVEKAVNELNKSSKDKFGEIKKSYGTIFDNKIIMSDSVKQQLQKIGKLSKKQAEDVLAYNMKKEKELTTYIRKQAEDVLAYNMKKEKELTTYIRKEQEKRITEQKKQQSKMERDAQKSALKQQEWEIKRAASTQTLGDKIANYAQTYLIYQGFSLLKQAAADLVQEMVDVEYQMVQIDRVLNDSTFNVEKYRDELIQLAYDYGNSFENVADITLRLAQAGFDAEQSLKLTEKTLLALNTAELNATQATSDMVAVMAQWGLNQGDANEVAKEYSDIIDKINIAADRFPTTSEDIMNALKRTSSAFNIAGASIDETIASIVAAETVSQRGGKAIGTALNNIVAQLKEDKRLDIAESLGIDFFKDEAKTEFKDIMDIFGQLADKMQELKDAGKENSIEMQTLTNIFTVFRRNIGTSLLGEMDEGGVYDEVMQLLEAEETIGYSMRENAKHMETAKAAQAQFNAELLKLKTAVWDGGAEDVFRGLLMLGTDLVQAITTLVDSFGTVPVALGVATLALSIFNKNINTTIQTLSTNLATKGLQKLIKYIKNAVFQLRNLNQMYGVTASGQMVFNVSAINGTTAMKGLGIAIDLVKVKTIALQAVLSLGLSLAITAVTSLIYNLITAEEKQAEKAQEQYEKTKEQTEQYKEQKQEIQELIKSYNSLRENSADIKEYELEVEINKILKEHNVIIDEELDSLDKKIAKLKEIEEIELRRELASKQSELNQQRQNKSLNVEDDYNPVLRYDLHVNDVLFNERTLEEQKQVVEEYIDYLKKNKDVEEVGYDTNLKYAVELYEEILAVEKDLIPIQNEVNELMIESQSKKFINVIKNFEDYKNALENIEKMSVLPGFAGSLEEQQQLFVKYINQIFPEFANALKAQSGDISAYNSLIDLEIEKLSKLSDSYSTLSSATKEFNDNGAISVDTFKQLRDNDLIQYLDIVNGKMVINTNELAQNSQRMKEKIAEDIKLKAAEQILAIVQEDTNNALKEQKTAANTSVEGAQTASNGAIQMANSFNAAYLSISSVNDALKGQNIDPTKLTESQNERINDVLKQANNELKILNNMSYKVAKSSGAGSRARTKTFEEQSQERIKIFKNEISEYEKLEQQWVNKYKQLEMFSTSDLKFITRQRINRYNEYLNQIRGMGGISEEDRNDLLREFDAERQKIELEYFDLLKDELNDQIDALKKANEEKINLIEEEAEARIEALQKVEKENDRIREKEEYERKRQELIHGNQGIEYWKQRTGREAQVALQEAQAELEELDREWNEKKEDWTLEDQIKEIEDARDAQIKAIEDAQETQIKAWEAAYKRQVELYAQTGQIIYDNSIINAGYLYNAYMDNFVNPLNARLREISAAAAAANAAAEASARKVSSSAQGDTAPTFQANRQDAEKALANFNAIIDSVNNDKKTQVVNKVNSLFVGSKPFVQFHGGGETIGNREGFALLKPNEVILKPEWAADFKDMIKTFKNNQNISNNSTVTKFEVQGNLINMEAKINNRQDADYVAKQVEKTLKDKFNIKK